MGTNKRFYRALGIMLLTTLFTMEFPYSDKSLLQYIVPEVEVGGNYLSELLGMIAVGVILIWCIREIQLSEKLKMSGCFTFLLFFVIVLPFAFEHVGVVKTPIYRSKEGVDTIEMVDSSFKIYNLEEYHITMKVTMKYHNTISGQLNIQLELPEELKPYFKEEVFFIDGTKAVYKDDLVTYSSNYRIEPTLEVLDEKILYKNYGYKLLLSLGSDKREYKRNDGF
jgi:hypothetical protein